MTSIQDHSVKAVHRYIDLAHPGDPAALVERTWDDEELGVYFDYLAWYHSSGETVMWTGKEKDNG